MQAGKARKENVIGGPVSYCLAWPAERRGKEREKTGRQKQGKKPAWNDREDIRVDLAEKSVGMFWNLEHLIFFFNFIYKSSAIFHQRRPQLPQIVTRHKYIHLCVNTTCSCL